jgi:hypothetical protein
MPGVVFVAVVLIVCIYLLIRILDDMGKWI